MSADHLRAICGAKTNAGTPCRAQPMPNGRCDKHGGKSTGHGTLKHGRYSKFLPVRLAARYEEARQDVQLLSLSEEMALLDARLAEVLEGLDQAESALGWQKAFDVWEKAKGADQAERLALFRELDDLLRHGLGQQQKWQEVATIMELRRKLAQTEAKRLADMQQFITAQQANLLVAALIRVVQENVDDGRTRQRISIELARLLDRPAPLGPGGE